MGAHHFDIAQWAMGMDGSGPVEVIYPGLKDPGRVSYRYANGVVMNHVGGNCLGLTVYGTEGEVYIARNAFRTKPGHLIRESTAKMSVQLYESNNHHGNWVDCMRTRRRCVADVEIGAGSATVCHLGNIAYELQRSLKWDPAAGRFKNDPQANRLLSHANRSAWM